MTKCRCTEISKIWMDIDKLTKSKTKLNNMYYPISVVEDSLLNIADAENWAYKAANKQYVCNSLKEIDDELRPTISDVIFNVDRALASLLDLKNHYEKEDEQYHYEQEKLVEDQYLVK